MPNTALYEPLFTYKPFAPSIGVVDGGYEYVSLAGLRMPWPFTTRMTVVQLSDGSLFLHSPVAYDPMLATRLETMGKIRHLVSPNRGHYAHIGEWSRALPDAITWASPGVRRRAASQHLIISFRRDLGAEPQDEWVGDLDQLIIPGVVLDEVVFFHYMSKTLIVADTLMNFEPDRLKQPFRFLSGAFGICAPRGGMPVDMHLAFWPRKSQVRPAFERILSWRPERVILSHGRCFGGDAMRELQHAFGWAL